MRALRSFTSCLVRQVNAAVRIEMSTADCMMNSKSEFHQAPLVRVVPVVGLREEQGVEEQSGGVQGGGRGRGRGGRARGRGRARSNGGVAGVRLFDKITWIYIYAIILQFCPNIF